MAISSSRAISLPAIIAGLGGGNAVGTNAVAVGATLTNSLSTGNATNPNFVIQVGVKTGSGATQATPTTALTIVGETLAATFVGAVAAPTLALGGAVITGEALGVIGVGQVAGAASGNATGSFRLKGGYSNSSGLFFTQNSATDAATILQAAGGGTLGIGGNNAVGLQFSGTNAATFLTTIATAAPAGSSAGLWKLGALQTGAVVLDTTRSLYVDVGGVVYHVMLST